MGQPIHRHIGRQMRKYQGHFTKYLFKKDTLLATLSVLVLLILLGMIKLNFYVLNPLKLALKDFDFNDLAYAKLGKKADSIDRRIIIVNTGQLNRAELGFIIEKVYRCHPRVIGLDLFFENARDGVMDSILQESLKTKKGLVAASVGQWESDEFRIAKNYFDDFLPLRGYANFISEEVGTVRLYSPFEEADGEIIPHFSTAIVREYDIKAYEKLEERHKHVEMINYSRYTNQYQVINPDELMKGDVDETLLKDKIVLLGFVNTDPNNIEDKKFTPMNSRFAGKSTPDMNGVVIQANIISMVLDKNYINKMPKWVAWLTAILIGWVHMSLFIRYYLEDHIWFHLVAKLAQVFSAVFFAYLGIFIFEKFKIKLDMKYTLYVIVLAVDVIYFYEALVVWLHKKTGFKTIFHQHHHG